jgi:hypothetical protein
LPQDLFLSIIIKFTKFSRFFGPLGASLKNADNLLEKRRNNPKGGRVCLMFR